MTREVPSPPGEECRGGLEVRLTPRLAVTVLAAGAAALVLAGIAASVSRVEFGRGRLYGLVPLFDLDAEANLPATYAGALLALCAVALWVIAAGRRQSHQPRARTARALSVLLLAMALDEVAQIHELLSEPVRGALDLDGFLYYSWVVVYGAVALAVAIVLLPAAASLSRRTRTLVLTAAGLYVGGALGFELLGSAVADDGGRGGRLYALLTTVEESLEYAGVLLLLYVLLTSIAHSFDTIRVRVRTVPH